MSKICSALAMVVALSSAAAMAQNGGASRAAAAPSNKGTVIAVVDTLYVLNKHEKMKEYHETYNKRVAEMKAEFQNAAKELNKDKEKLRDLKIGSDEYRKLMESLIQREADQLANQKVRESQLAEERAKMQFETYLDVQTAIKNFATRNGIDLVLNFDSEKANFENPQSLGRAMTSIVQFQSDLDITFDILKIVSPNYSATKPTVKGGAAAPTTRPTTKKG